MARSLWVGALMATLACTTPGWTQAPQGWFVTIREANQPVLKCRVLKCWREKDGSNACEVQSVSTGEMITMTLMDSPGGLGKAPLALVYHWGAQASPPKGVPPAPPDAFVVATAATATLPSRRVACPPTVLSAPPPPSNAPVDACVKTPVVPADRGVCPQPRQAPVTTYSTTATTQAVTPGGKPAAPVKIVTACPANSSSSGWASLFDFSKPSPTLPAAPSLCSLSGWAANPCTGPIVENGMVQASPAPPRREDGRESGGKIAPSPVDDSKKATAKAPGQTAETSRGILPLAGVDPKDPLKNPDPYMKALPPDSVAGTPTAGGPPPVVVVERLSVEKPNPAPAVKPPTAPPPSPGFLARLFTRSTVAPPGPGSSPAAPASSTKEPPSASGRDVPAVPPPVLPPPAPRPAAPPDSPGLLARLFNRSSPPSGANPAQPSAPVPATPGAMFRPPCSICQDCRTAQPPQPAKDPVVSVVPISETSPYHYREIFAGPPVPVVPTSKKAPPEPATAPPSPAVTAPITPVGLLVSEKEPSATSKPMVQATASSTPTVVAPSSIPLPPVVASAVPPYQVPLSKDGAATPAPAADSASSSQTATPSTTKTSAAKPQARPMDVGAIGDGLRPLALAAPRGGGENPKPMMAQKALPSTPGPAALSPPLPSPPPPAAAGCDPRTRQLLVVLRDALLPSERRSAIEELSHLDWKKQPGVVEALIHSAKNDPAPSVRASCVQALTRMRVTTPAVIQTVESLKFDNDVRVRKAVLQALTVLMGL